MIRADGARRLFLLRLMLLFSVAVVPVVMVIVVVVMVSMVISGSWNTSKQKSATNFLHLMFPILGWSAAC